MNACILLLLICIHIYVQIVLLNIYHQWQVNVMKYLGALNKKPGWCIVGFERSRKIDYTILLYVQKLLGWSDVHLLL